MKVEIWSDIMCPFCYIGKRKFEAALDQFNGKIEVEWKSFQLSPNLKTDPTKNSYDYLAEHKGISKEQAQQMANNVKEIAKKVGLDFDFEKAVVANTLNAHRFLHFTKTLNLQNEAEEYLFEAYFTKGKNIDSAEVLHEIGDKLSIDKKAIDEVLNSSQFTSEVEADIREAQTIGVRGVPFFVFNRKYAVSGAQDSQAFLEILEKAFREHI